MNYSTILYCIKYSTVKYSTMLYEIHHCALRAILNPSPERWVWMVSYRLHQAVCTAPLLSVVRPKLGGNPEGGVGPVGLAAGDAARARWCAVPAWPTRRGDVCHGGLLVSPRAGASGPFLLHQDEGGVEQAAPTRARVGPRGRGARGGPAAAAPGLVAAASVCLAEGEGEGDRETEGQHSR